MSLTQICWILGQRTVDILVKSQYQLHWTAHQCNRWALPPSRVLFCHFHQGSLPQSLSPLLFLCQLKYKRRQYENYVFVIFLCSYPLKNYMDTIMDIAFNARFRVQNQHQMAYFLDQLHGPMNARLLRISLSILASSLRYQAFCLCFFFLKYLKIKCKLLTLLWYMHLS